MEDWASRRFSSMDEIFTAGKRNNVISFDFLLAGWG